VRKPFQEGRNAQSTGDFGGCRASDEANRASFLAINCREIGFTNFTFSHADDFIDLNPSMANGRPGLFHDLTIQKDY